MSDDILEQAARRQHRRHPGPKIGAEFLEINPSTEVKKDEQKCDETKIDHDATNRRRRLPQPGTDDTQTSTVVPPFIRFKCQKQVGKALVDSTNPISTISSQFSQESGLLQSKGNYARNVDITIGEKEYKNDLKVIAGDGPDITLGLDFLQKNKCLLNFGRHTMTVGDDEISLLVERDIPLRFRPNIGSSATILSQTI